jgi:hypothetical protein
MNHHQQCQVEWQAPFTLKLYLVCPYFIMLSSVYFICCFLQQNTPKNGVPFCYFSRFHIFVSVF